MTQASDATRPRAPGRGRPTVVDFAGIAAILAIAAVIVLPQQKVRALLRVEEEVANDLVDLERREQEVRKNRARDDDADGHGEFAPLAEVLGSRAVQFTRRGDSDVFERDGFLFTVLLPNREKRGVPATSKDVVTNYAEVAELLVAWPAKPGGTGMRAYCCWPDGVVLQHAIDGYPYGDDPPVPDAPLVMLDSQGQPRPADRDEVRDWVPPSFKGK